MILGSGSARKAYFDYEVYSSWWSGLIWWDWGQKLATRYFAWKTNRKYERYLKYLRIKREIKERTRVV